MPPESESRPFAISVYRLQITWLTYPDFVNFLTILQLHGLSSRPPSSAVMVKLSAINPPITAEQLREAIRNTPVGRSRRSRLRPSASFVPDCDAAAINCTRAVTTASVLKSNSSECGHYSESFEQDSARVVKPRFFLSPSPPSANNITGSLNHRPEASSSSKANACARQSKPSKQVMHRRCYQQTDPCQTF